MKAVIFNSGSGSRMGELTKNTHKSLVCLENGETIFGRQLRLLEECGITDIVMTTGPYAEKFVEEAKKHPGMNITFVHNPLYRETNYIYSMFLAKEYLAGNFLLLHGDLVFDKGLLEMLLRSDIPSICLYNETKALPEKDFKCRLENGFLREVGINIFEPGCYAFQPLYKLANEDLLKWVKSIEAFVAAKNTGVYAENALNKISESTNIVAVSYKDHYIDEVDTPEDLKRVSAEILEFESRQHSMSFKY